MAHCALTPVRLASRAALCVLALLMVFGPTHAEEPTRVEDAVVTGTYDPFPVDRVPTNASIVTRRAIELRRPLDVPEMLGDLSGLNVLRFGALGSLTTLQIRGSGATDVLVLQDGRPLNQPSVGNVDFATMPVDYVDRVEVVRGPYSALYGGYAMSGVVNILTRPGSDKREIRLEGGGQGTSIASGTLSTKLGKARLELVPTWRTVNGARPNSQSELRNVFARLDVPDVGKGTLSLRGGLNGSSVGVPGPEPAADPALRTASQLTLGNNLVSSTVDRQSGNEVFGHVEWSDERFLVRAWTSAWAPTFHSEFADGFGGLTVSDTTTRQYSTAFEARARLPHLKESVLTLGGMWQHDAMGYGSTSTAFGTSTLTQFSSTRTTPSLCAEEALVLPRLQATLGMRYDRPSDFPGQLSPRLQARFEAADWLALRGAWGRGYRAPTLLELDFPPDPFVSGNPNLLPQRSTSYELGFDALPHRTARVRFTWFNDDVKDGSGTPPYPAAARADGVEGTVDLVLEIDASGAVTAVRVVSSSGSAVLDTAAERAAWSWRFRPGMRDGVAVSWSVCRAVVFRLE
ncbi:MAG: TonB-dependent receptor [Armatimonadetes bacterium]|nr:TonB-dependent receptor [Armatimonadota bacterium]